MAWILKYRQEAYEDLEKLDNSQQRLVIKALKKTLENPLPKSEGGYGKPLENRSEAKLAGLLKIKLLKAGIRIVYSLKRQKKTMEVIVISIREDKKVYKLAQKRIDFLQK